MRKYRPKRDPRAYCAMLANVDDNVGRLMRFLDGSGLAENTIVVFTSDHGEMLASHGRYDKMAPYSEAVDMPLIVRWPERIPAGRRSDALFTPIDFFPTLAGLRGVTVPSIVNGMDLSSQVLTQSGPRRDAALMMNFSSHWDYPQTMTLWPEWRGVRTGQRTYVRWINGAEELYDNREDPYKTGNLFDGRTAPTAMKQLRERLTVFLREAHDEFLPGTAYGKWFDQDRNLVRNVLGPVQRSY